MTSELRVVPHDPNWSKRFAREAESIERRLGELVIRIHHVGSTAIAGIHAKPVIDILLVVERVEGLDRRSGVMEEMGYEAMGEYGIPGRRYFRKYDRRGRRSHHVHAFSQGSSEVRRHLAFRDYMIAHPLAAREYELLKQQLAQKHPRDRQAYWRGKEGFIIERLSLALEWYRQQGR